MSPETYQLASDQLQISAEGKHVKQHELGDHLMFALGSSRDHSKSEYHTFSC